MTAAAGVVLWGFVTAPDRAQPPSEAFVTAQGILLTAVVFFLGFARSQHERSLDRFLEDERTHDRDVLSAHMEHPDGLPWLRLERLARNRYDYVDSLVRLARTNLGDMMAIPRLENALEIAENGRRRLEVDVWRLEREKRGDDGPEPDEDRREELQRRIDVDTARARNYERRAEALRYRLAGREKARIFVDGRPDPFSRALKTTLWMFLLAEGMVLAMLMLYGLAAAQARWRPNLTPGPHWWAQSVFIVVAIAYVAVSRFHLRQEHLRLAVELEQLPLMRLDRLEKVLPSDDDVSGGWGANHDARDAWRYYEKDFAYLAATYPAVGWVRSLRGRDLLWQALQTVAYAEILAGLADYAEDSDQDPRAQRELAVARTQFSAAVAELEMSTSAGDDPVAMVALDCALEQRHKVGLGKRDHDKRIATKLATDAAELLVALDDTDLQRVPVVWSLNRRTWLWPGDLAVRAAMRQIPGIENADPCVRLAAT